MKINKKTNLKGIQFIGSPFKRSVSKKETPIWLNIGCGVSLAKPPFINVDNFFDIKDLEYGQKTKKGMYKNARIPKGAMFVRGDMCDLPFDDNYADYIECNDAIEHIPMNLILKALSEMYRVLKPGGKLGLSTTNFDELAKLWNLHIVGRTLSTDDEKKRYFTLSQVIYGNQAGPGEFHKSPFNPFSLGYYLQNAGFKLGDISITIFPTNSPVRMPQKAYGDIAKKLENTVILTEMMWAEAIKSL